MSTLPTLSSRQQIKSTLKRELVPVEEWGYQVWVSELSAAELDEFRLPMYQMTEDGKLKINMAGQSIRMAVLSMQDEHGNRIYPDTEEGIELLGAEGAAGVEVVAKVARRLSRQTDEAQAALEGNSDAGTTGDSPSA